MWRGRRDTLPPHSLLLYNLSVFSVSRDKNNDEGMVIVISFC